MKKVLFTLVALIATMSMNAQVKVTVMKISDGETPCGAFNVKPTMKVTFEKVAITGTEKRNDNIDVNWVQLWEGGPKFAEYNVGATKEEDYGDYFSWGALESKSAENYNTKQKDLTGDTDTATKLWGDKWCMPTKEDLKGLLENCNVEWTADYNDSGIKGYVFMGKDEYKSVHIFFPAAGYYENGQAHLDDNANYWTSSVEVDKDEPNNNNYAYDMFLGPHNKSVGYSNRNNVWSVRAVLKENNE